MNVFADSGVALYFPEHSLATDNAIMIALAAHAKVSLDPTLSTRSHDTIVAKGNLTIHTTE